jgi:hypothetical protein
MACAEDRMACAARVASAVSLAAQCADQISAAERSVRVTVWLAVRVKDATVPVVMTVMVLAATAECPTS